MHIIRVDNITLKLKVRELPVEKLPLDLLLKYDKNLKVSGGKNVIYKGFQLSEGNFLLIIYALLSIAIILVALGLYSSLLKGIKDNTLAILRAIGASNKQIARIATKEILLYLAPSILGGIFVGFLVILLLQKFNIMRAFGHNLIIIINVGTIAGSLIAGFGFLIISAFLILRKVFHSKITYLMGSEVSEKEVKLEEVLNER
jgi:ABC-type antimicrobial peptide transport system permease subunit